MERVYHYYGKYQGLRGQIGGLPGWAKLIVFLAAVPGIILIALSVVAFLVSILALLILTLPVYRVLSGLTAGRKRRDLQAGQMDRPNPRKHVDVTVVE
jgi:hypothetical protein